jgi:hypothetical protein
MKRISRAAKTRRNCSFRAAAEKIAQVIGPVLKIRTPTVASAARAIVTSTTFIQKPQPEIPGTRSPAGVGNVARRSRAPVSAAWMANRVTVGRTWTEIHVARVRAASISVKSGANAEVSACRVAVGPVPAAVQARLRESAVGDTTRAGKSVVSGDFSPSGRSTSTPSCSLAFSTSWPSRSRKNASACSTGRALGPTYAPRSQAVGAPGRRRRWRSATRDRVAMNRPCCRAGDLLARFCFMTVLP